MYLVKSIKLQIWALCMLGKEKWVEFIISVSRWHKSNAINRNNRFLSQDTLTPGRDIREEFFTGFSRCHTRFLLTLLNDVTLDLNKEFGMKCLVLQQITLQNAKSLPNLTLPAKFSDVSI